MIDPAALERVEQIVATSGFEGLIVSAKRLRTAADHAEQDFMNFLMAVHRTGHWIALSNGTFDSYLKRNHICDPERYRKWLESCRQIPQHVTRIAGRHAALESLRIHDPVVRTKVLTNMVEHAKNEGTTLSYQTAKKFVDATLGVQPKVRVTHPSVADLMQENEALRERVRELEIENARLRADCAEMGKPIARSRSLHGGAARI